MKLRLRKKPFDYEVQREQNTLLVMSDILISPNALLHSQEKEHIIRKSENNEKRRSDHITKSKTFHEQNGCKDS